MKSDTFPNANSIVPNLRTLKRWAQDAIMTQDSYDVNQRLVYDPATGQWKVQGQFSGLDVYQINADGIYIGDMSQNGTWVSLSNADIHKIAALQVADAFTVKQKMEWLLKDNMEWGSVMRCNLFGAWEQAQNIQMIGAVWAGQKVEVLEQRTFPDVLFEGVRANVPMSRIRTFNRQTDWEKTRDTLLEECIVQKCTAVSDTNGVIEPKGIIYLPLITRTASVWVFDRWLVS